MVYYPIEFLVVCVTDVFRTGKKDLSVIPEASQESANTSVYPLKVQTPAQVFITYKNVKII